MQVKTRAGDSVVIVALDSAALADSMQLPAWGDSRKNAHVTARLVVAPRLVADWSFWYVAPVSDTVVINLVRQGYAEHLEGALGSDSLAMRVTFTLGDAPMPPQHRVLHRAPCSAQPN